MKNIPSVEEEAGYILALTKGELRGALNIVQNHLDVIY